MELWEELLCNAAIKANVEIKFPSDFDLNKIIENKCYKALEAIKEIIEDDELEDEECFTRIEEIVRVFESVGSNGGSRHDF